MNSLQPVLFSGCFRFVELTSCSQISVIPLCRKETFVTVIVAVLPALGSVHTGCFWVEFDFMVSGFCLSDFEEEQLNSEVSPRTSSS